MDLLTRVCWLTQDLADLPLDDSWLSAREREVAGRMYFEKRRRDWKLGRWTAKRAVLHYLRLPQDAAAASTLEILAAADGAPEASLDGAACPCAVSISHSGDLAFCAVAPAGIALGCDLEEIRPREKNFADDYFTHDELRIVASAADADRASIVTLIWSAKESALKALRQGLRRDTRSVKVDLFEKESAGWKSLAVTDLESSRIFSGWYRDSDQWVRTIATYPPTEAPIELR